MQLLALAAMDPGANIHDRSENIDRVAAAIERALFAVSSGHSTRPVHVKTLRSQKLRMLLSHRKLLQSKAIAVENDLRATLRNFGLKVGVVGTVKFEARIKELVEDIPDLVTLIEPLLIVRRILRQQIGVLHRRLLAVVRSISAVMTFVTFGYLTDAITASKH